MTIINNGDINNQVFISTEDQEREQREYADFVAATRSIYAKDVNDIKINLRGELRGRRFIESQKALEFAIRAHKGVMRKDKKTPYIVHPFTMASDALAHPGVTDELVATILLHDVLEDTNTPIEALPVNDYIRRAIVLVTIKGFEGETKAATKERYYHELPEIPEALITKGFDRIANLNDAEGILSLESIIKNVKETHELLIPEFQKAKGDPRFTKYDSMCFLIRRELKRLVTNMAIVHHIELKPISTAA